MSRPLWIFLLISLLLHLGAFFVLEEAWFEDVEVEAFRARLLTRPRFAKPPRPTFTRPDLPRVQMEYLPLARGNGEAIDSAVDEVDLRPVPSGAPIPSELATEEMLQPKAGRPELAREEMPSVGGENQIDPFESEAMELVDLDMLAQADRERAVVIADPYSRRDIRGYVNFTLLRLDGAGSYSFARRPVMEDLARYLRDYTGVLTQLRPGVAMHFLSEELLKDPVHFLFPMHRRDGSLGSPRVALSAEEVALLGRYLREGGFLFVDGDGGPDGRRFLKSMVDHLREALGKEGRLFKIPATHAIYNAFYSYEAGFPGERMREGIDLSMGTWRYPERVPCGELPRGLWGVEWDGQLVAAISDLGLHQRWSGEETYCDTIDSDSEEEPEENPPRLPFLQAATNIVVYALTRPGGLTARRAPPAWEQKRPERAGLPVAEEEEIVDDGLLDELDASLALVHLPMGEEIGEGGMTVSIDGRFEIEVFRTEIDGLLLRNLPAGKHSIQVEYGGKQQRLEVELKGGRVATVGFKLRGLGFFTLLSLNPFEEQVWFREWGERFPDLLLDEHFLAGKEEIPAR